MLHSRSLQRSFPKAISTVSCPSTLHPRSLPTVSNPSTLHPCSLSPKICLKISHLSTLHPRFLPAKLLIYFQQFPVRASIFARSRAAFPLFPKVSGPSSLHPPCILVPPNGTFASYFHGFRSFPVRPTLHFRHLPAELSQAVSNGSGPSALHDRSPPAKLSKLFRKVSCLLTLWSCSPRGEAN